MSQEHSIETCTLLAKNTHAIASSDARDRLASVQDDLLELLNSIFDRYFTSDQVIEIERIQLDLGSIPLSAFKETYLNRVERLLVDQLEILIEKPEYKKHVLTLEQSAKLSSIELLELYFSQGFNAQLQKDKSFDFNDFFLSVFREDKDKVAELIKKNLDNAVFVKRLKNLNPDILKEISYSIPKSITEKSNLAAGEVYKLISAYIQGRLISSGSVLSPLDIENIILALSKSDGTSLIDFIINNRLNKNYIDYLAQVFTVEELINLFKGSSKYDLALKEWALVNRLVFQFETEHPSHSSYRIFFLNFILNFLYNKSNVSQLTVQFYQLNTHLIGQMNQENISKSKKRIESKDSATSDLLADIFKLLDEKNSDSFEEIETSDLDALVYYLRFGVLKSVQNVNELTQVLLNQNALSLRDSIKFHWKEEGLRFRLAFQLDSILLKQLIDLVWADHYTYDWWCEIEHRVDSHVSSKEGSLDLMYRELCFSYFNFLCFYTHTTVSEAEFEELFYTIITRNSTLKKEVQALVFLKDIFPLLLEQENKVFQSLDLLTFVDESQIVDFLEKCPDSVFEIYLESIVESEKELSTLFFSVHFSNQLLERVFVVASTSQLDRLFYRLVPNERYDFVVAFHRELSSVLLNHHTLKFHNHDMDLYWRQLVMSLMRLLRAKKGLIGLEVYLDSIVQRAKEVLKIDIRDLLSTSTLSNTMFIEEYPIVSSVIKHQSSLISQDKKISKSDFLLLLSQEFPSIFGFIHTYIIALEYYFYGVFDTSNRLSETYLNLIYRSLHNQGVNPSISVFIREANRLIEDRHQLSDGSLGKSLQVISEEQIKNGLGRFYPLRESLMSIDTFDTTSKTDQTLVLENADSHQSPITIKLELIGVWSNEFKDAFSEYILQGTFSNLKTSAYKDLSIDQFVECIQDIRLANGAELYAFFKQFFSTKSNIDSLISRNNSPLEIQIINTLSGNGHSDFVSWNDEVIRFVLDLKIIAEQSKDTLIVHLRRSVMDYLISTSSTVYSLHSYLTFVFNSVQDNHLFDFESFNEGIVLACFESNKYSYVFESNIKSILTTTSIGVNRNVLDTSKKEPIGVWSNEFRQAFSEYILQGTLSDLKTIAYKGLSIDQFVECIKVVRQENDKELYVFLKQFFSTKSNVDSLISRNNSSLEIQIINTLSGNRYSDFTTWNNELTLFLLTIKSVNEPSKDTLIVHLNRSALEYLVSTLSTVYSLETYLTFVFNSFQRNGLFEFESFNERAVLSYFESNNHLDVFENSVKAILTTTSINANSNILETSKKEKLGISSNDFKDAFSEYILQGTFSNLKTSAYKGLSIDQFVECIKVVREENETELYVFLKQFFSTKSNVDSFISRNNSSLEIQIINTLSGNGHSDFASWNDELTLFLLTIKSVNEPSKDTLIVHLNRSALEYLVSTLSTFYSLETYLTFVFNSFQRNGLFGFESFNERAVLSYFESNNHSDVFENSVKAILTTTSINANSNILETSKKEKLGIWSNDFKDAFSEYILQGTFSNLKTSAYKGLSIDQFVECIKDVRIANETELYSFLKQFFSTKSNIDRLISRNNSLLEIQIIDIVSRKKYSEFTFWNDELTLFLLNFKGGKPISKNVLSVRLRHHTLNYLCNTSSTIFSLEVYLDYVVDALHHNHVIDLGTYDTNYVLAYFKENKHSDKFRHSLKSIIDSHIEVLALANTKIDVGHSNRVLNTTKQIFDKTLNDLFFLVNRDAQQNVQLYLEYYLEQGNVLVEFLSTKNISKEFFLKLSHLLTDSLRSRFLRVNAPAIVSYFHSIRNELKHFSSLYHFAFEFERTLIDFYSNAYYQIHINRSQITEKMVDEAFIDSFYRVEGNEMYLKFEALSQLKRDPISIDFPVMYAILLKSSIHSESNTEDVTKMSLDDIQLNIQNTFPSLAQQIQDYVLLLESFYLKNTALLSSYSSITIHETIYKYLTSNSKSFSISGLIKYLNQVILSSGAFSEFYFIQSINQFVKDKLTQGQSQFSEIESELLKLYSHIPEQVAIVEGRIDSHLYQPNNSYISKDQFEYLITYYHKDVSGFIFTFIQIIDGIEMLGLSTSTEKQNALYLKIHFWLRMNKESFSSQLFVKDMIQWISTAFNINKTILIDKCVEAIKKGLKSGESRFYVLDELFKQDQSMFVSSKDILDTSLDYKAQDVLQMSEMLNYDIQKMHLEQFKFSLYHYILHETILETDYIHFKTIEEFKSYTKNYFKDHSGFVYPLLKEFLLKENRLEVFLNMKDRDFFNLILKEISGDRIEEFLLWKTQLSEFVRYLHPSISLDLFSGVLNKTLFQIVFNKDRVTVGLFSFLESAIENLLVLNIHVLSPEFRVKISVYESLGKADALFVKALERIDVVLAKQKREALIKELLEEKLPTKVEKIKLEGRLYIQNAGIILIAPFLNRYFSMLNMLEDGVFRNEETAARAVQLLQYLVVGSSEMQEHDLVLNKVLCGVPINLPIANTFGITDHEIEISKSLLNGVLSNWDKMNGSSIAALRETFLVRGGYLEETKTHWALEVDRRSLDILIDFIPWSFKLVKLPWMEMSIKTQWGKTEDE